MLARLVRSGSKTTLVTALALVLLLSGCYFQTSTPPTGPEVLVMGDSNVTVGGPNYISIIGPTYTTTVDGVVGATTASRFPGSPWPEQVTAVLAETQAVAIVIQLGTNDASTAAGAAAFAANLDAILTVIPSGTTVLWDNVRLPTSDGWTAENVDTVNAALTAATATWPNLQIQDLAGYFAGHPEWIEDANVHFTPEGYNELARWTLANLDAALTP